ncbi:MAG: D-aminoacyl-tRNA deacylase [Candidatus Omnitrophota bacterium]
MRIVLQRVKEASVTVDAKIVGRIGKGLLVFLAVAKDDTLDDINYLVKKSIELRIFEDTQGKMNCSIAEADGEFLVVSQFTLLGDCVKGRRPSFDKASDPKKGEEFYNAFVDALKAANQKVQTGQFRAMMDVALVNDGPVTFILESMNV